MPVLDRFRLDGNRFLITGGSRGLGRAMALALAEAGADGVLVGRDPEHLARTAAEIRERGRMANTIAADLADPPQCEQACREALEFGPVDILINNIGGRRDPTPVRDMSTATWLALINLNLTATFICTRLLGGPMLDRGHGRVINVSSISGLIANRDVGGRHYETAKAAVVQFTRATAADWAPHGVTVNAILPGGFMTEPNQRWARERPQVIETFRAQIPMGVFGEPEDLGPLAVYLASDASRYMTGAALVIDGGYTLW